MGTHHRTQVIELLAHLAADFFARETNHQSLITITRADLSPDFKQATIYFSIFPQTHEETALHFAKRQRSEFRNFVKKNANMKTIPFFEFVIDDGEKNRQALEDLSHD